MCLRAVAAASIWGLAQLASLFGAPLEADKKSEAALRRELRALLALADAVQTGEEVEQGLALRFESHLLKGSAGRTYVPYSVVIDEHSPAPESFTVYVRVVRRGSGLAPGGEHGPWGAVSIPPGEMPVGGVATRHRRSSPYGEASAVLSMLDRERQATSPYEFEDVHSVEVGAGEALRPFRLRRALSVPPGEYDVYVVARETAAASRPGARIAVLVQALSAPDFSVAELALSSLIVAERVETLPAALGSRQQARRPYALGTTEVVPAAEPIFTRDDEPVVVFQIYNASVGSDRKPEVRIEYELARWRDHAFVPYGRLAPRQLDSTTLPREFDPRADHQLGVVQSLPVASVPPGLYRLDVTVTDKLESASATAQVEFTVAEARAR